MPRHQAIDLASALILVAATAGCETSLPATSAAGQMSGDKEVVTIFAAASTANAVDEIKAAFVSETGAEVRTSYAASSTLAQQIVNGAGPDVFLSANVGWADYVESRTVVARRRNLLGNRLVVVVPSDSHLALGRPEDLLTESMEHLALADPDSAPAGKYARQVLVGLGLWDKLKGKVVPAKDVRHALTYVETGAAEAGIVYATDAAVSEKVQVAVEIPVGLTEPVLYPALLLDHGSANATAERLYDFLGSPEVVGIFEKFGFVVLTDAEGEAK